MLDMDLAEELFPEFNNKTGICFACDDKYIPYLCVAIQSLVENSSLENLYDIVIISTQISEKNKNLIIRNYSRKNITIRFYDVEKNLQKYDSALFYTSTRFSICTYYRFFIGEIFKYFAKIIYLDSDIIIKDDIAKLYNVDLQDNYVAATRDFYVPILTELNETFGNYLIESLQLNNCKDYFQAGVMIFNIDLCIKNNIKNLLIRKLNEVKTPFIVDQDILNLVCHGKTKYLDGCWNFDRNVEVILKKSYDVFLKIYSEEEKRRYNEIKKNPSIIHFAGEEKPWDNLKILYAYEFWRYALKTPFAFLFIWNYLVAKNYKKIWLLIMIK